MTSVGHILNHLIEAGIKKSFNNWLARGVRFTLYVVRL